MTFQKFIEKLNWRQVIIHFIAFWFISYAFLAFSYLHNKTLIEIARNTKGPVSNATFIENNISGDDLADFLLWNNLSPQFGLLISFIIALRISKKRDWLWVNSLLSFIAFYLLWRNNLPGWSYLYSTFIQSGKIFENAAFEFFTSGYLLLMAGLLFFYLKPITGFIERKKLTNT